MKHFVLVHGACHGAWYWYKVSTILTSAGHRVTAIDLAAAGIDPKKISEVSTFAEYTQPLFEFLSSLPSAEKVVLVGHSLGGINIALAMEKFPEKIAMAVFLTAFLPVPETRPSLVIEEYFKRTSGEALVDTKAENGNGLEKPPTSLLFGPITLSSGLYQLSPPEDLTLAKALLRVAPFCLEDLFDASSLSDARYGSVRSAYIVCDKDLAIPVEFQRWMIGNKKVEFVKEIEETDHMVMLCKPQELSKCLIDIANTCK